MQPQSPSPQYDFILKDTPTPKKRFGLPGLNLSRPLLIVVGATLIVIVLIIVSSITSHINSGTFGNYIGAATRAQEISRVSVSVETLAQTPQTKNLASSAQNVLTGEQTALVGYLTAHGVKPKELNLDAYLNTATDDQMKTASTTGNLDTVYATYLKDQLGKYLASLQAADRGAGPQGKAILDDAISSVQTLLAAPQIAASN